jgi:hypothetical protein
MRTLRIGGSMRNPETGKFEIRKVFKSVSQEVVGTGDTKEEARADPYRQLEASHRIPGTNVPGWRGPKWRPAMEPTGEYIRSPGFVFFQDEEGKSLFEYRADNKAQILAPIAKKRTAE